MEKTTNTAPAAEAENQEQNSYYLLDAPISELAEHAGVDIDEAVKLRVAAAIENAPPKMDITVRPVEPQGNLYGFAKVKIGGITMDEFKIAQNKDGELFVGMPSKPDSRKQSGYRSMAYVDKDFRDAFNAAVIDKYYEAVEKLKTRAAAMESRPRMAEQMKNAAKEAEKHNAARPAPPKGSREAAAEL